MLYASFIYIASTIGRHTGTIMYVPPTMMWLDLIVAVVCAALKWKEPLTQQGKEEDSGFGKNDISRFILNIARKN
jgi:hypothetical protein